jgi:hypothetical protein
MIPGSWVGPQWGKAFYIVYIGKKFFSKTSWPISIRLNSIILA